MSNAENCSTEEAAKAISARATQLFNEHDREICIGLDKLFAILLVAEWFAGLATAMIWSPRTWAGAYSDVHSHVWLAAWVGFAIISMPVLMVWKQPGSTMTRHCIGIAQALMTSLLIHLSGGRIETHFLIFGSLAFLAFYRHWPVLISASIIVALDHLIRGVYFPQSAYGVPFFEPWRWVEHTAWVCFADVFLVRQCIQAKTEMRQMAHQRAVLESSYDTIEREVIARTAESKANEARFRSLCTAAPITIFETDVSGRWTFLSARWQNLTGLTSDYGLENGWLLCIHQDDRVRVKNNYRRALETGSDWNDEFRIVVNEDEVKWVRATGTRFASDDRPSSGLVGTIEDVTEQLNNEENIKHIAVMEQRQEFMATLSHDLKNPLIGANRVLELFVDGVLGPLSTQQVDLLSQLKQSNDSLLKMIQNLIAAYRYEKEDEALQYEKIDFCELITLCQREIQPLATDKKVTLDLHRPNEPLLIWADQNAILRVSRNLLDNALKFTPSGGKVEVHLVSSAQQVLLRVSNTGSYIPKDKRQMLFRRFWQGQDGKRYVPGTGLGLYICKQILDSHRGDIKCYSNEKTGTEFVVSLPCAA